MLFAVYTATFNLANSYLDLFDFHGKVVSSQIASVLDSVQETDANKL